VSYNSDLMVMDMTVKFIAYHSNAAVANSVVELNYII
jgi:hypothetical protein